MLELGASFVPSFSSLILIRERFFGKVKGVPLKAGEMMSNPRPRAQGEEEPS